MKTSIYSVYDSVANVYSSPIVLINDDVAIRIMKNCVNNPEHNYALNPEDYHLHKLADFDDQTGEIVHNIKETKLVSLLSLSNKPNIKEATV